MQNLVEYRVADGKRDTQHYVYRETKTCNYYVNKDNQFLIFWKNRSRKRREGRADAPRQGTARENERENGAENERAKCRKKIRQCEKSRVKRRFILLYA